ncbi:peptidyl-prolyl cis-trans isomerase-like [Argonauta hians]
MYKVFLICLLFSVIGLSFSTNLDDYTVTDEAWFDITIMNFNNSGEDHTERIVIALFGNTAPMTVTNFAAITRGYVKGDDKLHYKSTFIHRIVPDFVIQMGDITKGDGTGGRSIYGDKFDDEVFILSHKAAGYVSMANHGKNTNGSQFFILLNKARWLDKKHVVFGKVIKGMDMVHKIGNVRSNSETAVPETQVKIVDCGMNAFDRKYKLTEEQASSDKDL